MPISDARTRLHLHTYDQNGHQAEFAFEVERGLTASPKRLPCRYFYDGEGSRLFEEICALPEYYLTRTERLILEQHAHEIASMFSEAIALVELGSGSAVKTRLLIEAFLRRPSAGSYPGLRYVPIDISPSILEESSLALLQAYPGLEIVAVAAEYREGLARVRAETDRPKLILWLGSNLGNLDRREAMCFLRTVRDTMTSRDRLLVGIDMRKGREELEAAYDDARGVTARFNLNLLARINRELGGQFDLTRFRHRALYNETRGRVELYLDSLDEQRVRIEGLGLDIPFEPGESIHTENSYKYSQEEIEELAEGADLETERQWFDARQRFCVNLFAPLSPPSFAGKGEACA
jgi:dimethylhistidine N-methyltransferase